MKLFRVVVDSSCLIGLAQIKKFDLLKEIFREIFIPEAVYKEVVIRGKGEAGSKETKTAVKEGWIVKKKVKDRIAVNALSSIFGIGESEVIILSKELGSDYALIDEKIAREQAELMDINTMGIFGIIDLALEKDISINKRDLVDQLREAGFRINTKLYKQMFLESK